MENLVNLINSTPTSQLTTMPQILAALGLPYSGPTSAQVGPQLGPLTTSAPVYPTSNPYPNYPAYPQNPTTPPWVYSGTQPSTTITTQTTTPIAVQNPAPTPVGGQPVYYLRSAEGGS